MNMIVMFPSKFLFSQLHILLKNTLSPFKGSSNALTIKTTRVNVLNKWFYEEYVRIIIVLMKVTI
jgi:hypothetical protein